MRGTAFRRLRLDKEAEELVVRLAPMPGAEASGLDDRPQRMPRPRGRHSRVKAAGDGAGIRLEGLAQGPVSGPQSH